MSTDRQDEQYHGPGRLTAAVGKGFVAGTIAAIPGGLTALLGLGTAIKDNVKWSNTPQKIGEGLRNAPKRGFVIAGLGLAATVGSGIWGFVSGWRHAKHAKEDHERLVGERDQMEQKNVTLQQGFETMKAAVQAAGATHASPSSHERKSHMGHNGSESPTTHIASDGLDAGRLHEGHGQHHAV